MIMLKAFVLLHISWNCKCRCKKRCRFIGKAISLAKLLGRGSKVVTFPGLEKFAKIQGERGAQI